MVEKDFSKYFRRKKKEKKRKKIYISDEVSKISYDEQIGTEKNGEDGAITRVAAVPEAEVVGVEKNEF